MGYHNDKYSRDVAMQMYMLQVELPKIAKKGNTV